MDKKNYEVKIDNIFEGPMDLLVYLIKKNEVNIYDIPIGLITDQYLSYLEWMKSMNIDLAGEFLVMAATLTQIKSKMLLPQIQDDSKDIEDPRLEITRPLLEYLKLKEAAKELLNRSILGEDTFIREVEKKEELNEEYYKVELFDLIYAFQNVLDKLSNEPFIEFTIDTISIKDKISEITNILEDKGVVLFNDLFNEVFDRKNIVLTFLAILEMAKLNLIQIIQHIQDGDIRLLYI
ncbi:MAG: segregation/condensation protein A [Desulfobacterales bacterium]|nr:segregation/condensation protein A [Desulfobacterales bacterium]MBF0395321.1 segregation/condensation protein A [Desulfobacterales bacterium]